MGLAIHNLIESVCNPSGRFKMLDGIRVKTDSKGDLYFCIRIGPSASGWIGMGTGMS